jgi:tetratricopeptide (TPR) repeat protein
MLFPMLLLGAALAFYLIFRFDVLDGSLTGSDPGPTLPFLREGHRVLNALRAFPEFLRLLVFPVDLSADYSPGIVLPVESVTPMTLVGVLLLVGLVVLALMTPWRPALGFPAGWFLISIITVSNLFFPIGVLIAERTLYLPSFAISALIAYAWLHGLPRASRSMQRAAPIALVIVVLLMGVRTWVRNPDWASTDSVVNALLRDNPESYRSQWVAAVNQWRAGNTDSASDHFQLGYRIYARDPQFKLEYANFLLTLDRNEQALSILEEVYATHPYVTRSLALLSYAYLNAGRHADALRTAREAERQDAPRGTTLVLQALALDGLGDHNGAIGTWRVATHFALNLHWTTWAYLARSFALAGDVVAALDAAERARLLAADDPGGLQRIDALQHAIRSGCYAEPTGQPGTSSASACDPLAGWVHVPMPPQNANQLQNARPKRAAGL